MAEYSYMGLRYYFLGFLFAGDNILSVTYFSATDNARIAFIGSITRGAVAIVFYAVVPSKLFLLKEIWFSFLVAELITFMAALITAIIQRKKSKTIKRETVYYNFMC